MSFSDLNLRCKGCLLFEEVGSESWLRQFVKNANWPGQAQ